MCTWYVATIVTIVARNDFDKCFRLCSMSTYSTQSVEVWFTTSATTVSDAISFCFSTSFNLITKFMCVSATNMDNICMHPKGDVHGMSDDLSMPIYKVWLHDSLCETKLFAEEGQARHLAASSGSRHYIDSVPKAHRRKYRWGWKNSHSL